MTRPIEAETKELYAVGAIASKFSDIRLGDRVVHLDISPLALKVQVPCDHFASIVTLWERENPLDHNQVGAVTLHRKAAIFNQTGRVDGKDTRIDYWLGRCKKCRTIYWC